MSVIRASLINSNYGVWTGRNMELKTWKEVLGEASIPDSVYSTIINMLNGTVDFVEGYREDIYLEKVKELTKLMRGLYIELRIFVGEYPNTKHYLAIFHRGELKKIEEED